MRAQPNSRFWGNVRRLIGLVGEGSLVQYSVFMTRSRRGAMAVERIARHYGASVMVRARLYGHLHHNQVTTVDGVLHVQAGSMQVQLNINEARARHHCIGRSLR